MRAPFQVLVIPFRRTEGGSEFAVLKRSDLGWWQFVSGGGEGDEVPLAAAEREAREELGISAEGRMLPLDSTASVPKTEFAASREWPDDIYVIPEHCFAVDVGEELVSISSEHTEVRWVCYDEARELLKWEGNRTALWELRERLAKGELNESP
jgi:dATP pyrophosphohydrolase